MIAYRICSVSPIDVNRCAVSSFRLMNDGRYMVTFNLPNYDHCRIDTSEVKADESKHRFERYFKSKMHEKFYF